VYEEVRHEHKKHSGVKDEILQFLKINGCQDDLIARVVRTSQAMMI
jgi:hypothetical protein